MTPFIIAGCGAVFFFFFLGRIQSHWIAPAVLFIVSLPLLITARLGGSIASSAKIHLATLLLFYAAFAVGHLTASEWWKERMRRPIQHPERF